MIDLAPMTPAEFRRFIERSTVSYAEDHVRAGNWSAEEAAARSASEIQGLLPKGIETADHFLYSILGGPSREPVGSLWYALRRVSSRIDLYVYWIGIDDRFRRRGYASDTFQRLEVDAVRLGASRIALQVFGDNLRARALYEKLGFEPTNLLMARKVSPPAPGGTPGPGTAPVR
ncbi:MAG: GNAT family N-acetyltransferase [Thermoplasmata archaeon]|nr:GNAT family N-acetyltransferase [Thermoplasmata archaeon]